MAVGIYEVTEQFEAELAKYTGAPYCVTVDNASNALFLCLKYIGVDGLEIEIPSHTYPSVPCSIIHAGAKIKFLKSNKLLTGAYQLKPTNIYDSALRFTADMYIPGSMMCLSFTGPYKHFKLSKGGAILLDDPASVIWLKKARFSGRGECSYHDDYFEQLGWNYYLMPEISMRGMLLIKQFYSPDGKTKKENADLSLEYPDLSKFQVYKESVR